MINVKSYTGAVNAFIEASPWLGDEDLPAIIALQSLAHELDTAPVQAAMVGQFGLTYRALLKRQPAVTEDEDELTKAMRASGL